MTCLPTQNTQFIMNITPHPHYKINTNLITGTQYIGDLIIYYLYNLFSCKLIYCKELQLQIYV